MGDVDGDGDLDFVTANENGVSVSVRLNGGDNSGSNTGEFKNGSEVPITGRPTAVVLADVDGDGDLDMLVSHSVSTLSVRLNGGDATGSNTGTFSGSQEVALQGNTASYANLAVGDVDGDGDIDLVVGVSNLNGVGWTASVRLNGGDASGSNTGQFSGTQNVPVEAYSVALGDMDADGDLDLVTSTGYVRLNGGDASGSNTGVFSGAGSFSTGSGPYGVGLADVDGDGDLDILTTDFYSGIGVRLNQPPAPVITSLSQTTAPAGTAITLAGANLTGVTLSVGGKAAVITNNTGTSLTFTVPAGSSTAGTVKVSGPGGNATTPFTVTVVLVAATPKANSRNGTRLLYNARLTFSEPISSNSAYSIALYSAVAGGGNLGTFFPSGAATYFSPSTAAATNPYLQPGELVSVTVPAYVQSEGGIAISKRVYRFTAAAGGIGRGNFQPGSENKVGPQPQRIVAADIDRDGDQDLLAAAYDNGAGKTVSVRLNAGNGTFAAGPDLTLPGTSQGVHDVLAVDLNADGALDVVTANTTTSDVSTFLNNGRGSFTAGTTLAVGASPQQLVAADVDANGTQDLLVVTASGTTVWLNAGYGGFYTRLEVKMSLGEQALATADVDNDGDLDLLTTNGSANTVSIRLNDGTGSFSGIASLATGRVPSGLVMNDIDDDGDLDLLTANAGDNTVSVFVNDGLGNFSSRAAVAVGLAPASLALADIDADGDLDLLTANGGDNTASVRLNDGAGAFADGGLLAIGQGPAGLALADVDNDGDLDLLAANSGANTVSVRFNQAGAPTLLSLSPTSGAVGQSITLTGTNLAGATGVSFNGTPASFKASSTTSLKATVPVGATTGTVTVTTPQGTSNGVLFTVTEPQLAVAQAATSYPNGGLAYNFGSYRPGTVSPAVVFTLLNAGTADLALAGTATTGDFSLVGPVPASVPAGSTATVAVSFAPTTTGVRDGVLTITSVLGTYTVSLEGTGDGGKTNIVVTTSQNLAGDYNDVTITGTGVATLSGPLTVNGTLSVEQGGTLNQNGQLLTGPGTMQLQAGATLVIGDAAGITSSGATGAVQLTGGRFFAADASYVYAGTGPQTTGDGLPTQVRNLTTLNTSDVTLSADVAVAQVLTVGSAGNLLTAGHTLTLLSSASGTALVVNASTGVVSGAATVQRYIDPSTNPGLGYRHYAPPVTNSTVADFSTAGFIPVVNATYNTSATPGAVTPFPTIFSYDQRRLATTANTSSAFDKGFFSPASLSEALVPGGGYTVNIGAAQLVDFVGTLGTGDQTVALARGADADAGWALVGNPYPAPLDYSLVAAADRENVDAAIYVVQSTGQYAGHYRSYVNGVGGNPILSVAQGFFVRVQAGQTSGHLTFRNSQRLTTPDATAFQRLAADPRPLVQLDLRGLSSVDAFYVYAEAGATTAFDSQYDAAKLPNSTGLNLSSQLANGQQLAIDGQPVLAAGTTLALGVGVPGAGTYTLVAAQLKNLPVGLEAYLHDALTNKMVKLTAGSTYQFAVTAEQAKTTLTGRFTLVFHPQAALATSPAALAALVQVYPNPAHESCTVVVPSMAGATTVRIELLNALGQVVLRQATALSGNGATLTLPIEGLAPGVYVLRLQAAANTLIKRIAIN
ncbi:FG-GAP-like repeat-containing protein [Hymenobacter cheonanensis]|uniref:FG-GAP-like repeat-containing protein n=1 Tax=Hymenobacter sp. CA2-7 TaxID=3063993 RepID=UPI002713DA61|nr:FG-GAP-like repeat-containing protein [Hymenobacter sp. CA2-7]MDO7884727.1 FG-GAP-like repeat-containing protein [Hymenobacter sp. CA2-7]